MYSDFWIIDMFVVTAEACILYINTANGNIVLYVENKKYLFFN